MCRLLGLIANKEVDLRFSLIQGPKTLSTLSQQNEDGWGCGWYEEGKPRVIKEAAPAHSSEQYPRTVAEAKSRIFVAHVRKATTGSRKKENCHPFQYHRWLFAHNGCVDRESLLQLLNETNRSKILGETDSEAYFHWILQNIEDLCSQKEGIASALSALKRNGVSYTGLNFLLTDGVRLYAYRDASCETNYYTLFYLVRKPGPQQWEALRSKDVRAMLESKALKGEKAILVCSERLTEEAWQEIPLGHLLVVGPGLNWEISDLR